MKNSLKDNTISSCLSPPSRRRGLKICFVFLLVEMGLVASFAEAWIENGIITYTLSVVKVASFAEAWIEKIQALIVSY